MKIEFSAPKKYGCCLLCMQRNLNSIFKALQSAVKPAVEAQSHDSRVCPVSYKVTVEYKCAGGFEGVEKFIING